MKKINSILKRLALVCLVMFAGVQMYAQERVELKSNTNGVQIKESSLNGFKSTFSFNSIESNTVETEAGDFSVITIDRTVLGGELGAPSLPIARELVAVPFGATPVVKVVGFTTTDYNLNDYDIKKVYPQQPSYSKSTKVEDMVLISVCDTGVGMNEEELRRCTEPFYTTKPAGTGIGLAITHQYIEEIGGELKISSEKNQFTCVEILLPGEEKQK